MSVSLIDFIRVDAHEATGWWRSWKPHIQAADDIFTYVEPEDQTKERLITILETTIVSENSKCQISSFTIVSCDQLGSVGNHHNERHSMHTSSECRLVTRPLENYTSP